MAVTREDRSVVFTANGDEVTGVFRLDSLALVGTGMTLASRLTVKDGFDAILADHYVANVNENVEFMPTRKTVRGIKITAAPTGTWSVVARHD